MVSAYVNGNDLGGSTLGGETRQMASTRSALLGAGRLTSIGMWQVYETPASACTVVKEMMLSNTAAAALVGWIFFDTAAGQAQGAYLLGIDGFKSMTLPMWHVVPAGWRMYLYFDAVAAANYWVSGAILEPIQPFPPQLPTPAAAAGVLPAQA